MIRKHIVNVLSILLLVAAKHLQAEGSSPAYGRFVADMSRSTTLGGFTIGDTLLLQITQDGLLVREKRMVRLGLSSYYEAHDTLDLELNDTLNYQYCIVRNSTPVLEEDSLHRSLIVSSTIFTLYDTSSCPSCERRKPLFLNGRRLRRNVTVSWEVDMRPAIYQAASGDTLIDIQGYYHVTDPDSVIPAGVWINGPATGSWQSWGLPLYHDTTRAMYDDGTHGDVLAGDTIFTRVILASPDSLGIGTKGQVLQSFQFGIHGGNNEGGRGGFGDIHVDTINDTVDTFTIPSQWGSINRDFYRCWDYENHRPQNCVTDVPHKITPPQTFGLYQNFPNPFNPTTTIRYDIPLYSYVRLEVCDLLGRLVDVVFEADKAPGTYEIRWKSNLASGVYLLRLTANSANHLSSGLAVTRKVILLK